MIITAVSVGTRGDVEPLPALGSEMRERGHIFRILTHPAFRDLVEECGVSFFPLSTDADHVMQYLVTDYRTSLDFCAGMFRLKRENPAFMEETLKALERSDLVIYGTCSAFARHAAELLHIPCARAFYSPMDATDQYSLYCDEFYSDKVRRSYRGLAFGMNLMTMAALNGWRRRNGLKPWGIRDSYREMEGRRVLTFYPTSRLLMPEDPAWGENVHVTGYWTRRGSREALPEKLEAFLAAGERPVFVTFGKARSGELAEVQRRMVRVVQRLGLRAVIQAGCLTEEEKRGTERVFFAGDLPYASVFPRMRAVIHHGGNTTNGLALAAGCPVLVIGLALDQCFYGRVDAHIGVGPQPLCIRRGLCSETEIEERIRDLISGRYDAKAALAGKSIRSEDGLQNAADAIEAYGNST